MALAQPANDNCSNAIEITYGNTSINTTGATTDGPDEPTVCDFNSFTQINNDIWYEFVALSNCSHTVSACTTSGDAKLAIYDATFGCPGGEFASFCSDDFCGSGPEITFNPAAGKRYLIRVGGGNNGGAAITGTLKITAVNCQPPTFNGCPPNANISNNNNTCSAVYNWTAPTANDNTSVASIVGSHTPPFVFPVGTTTVTYVATDDQGNSSACRFDVTVNDVQDPTLTACPANITQDTDPDMCDAVVTWTPPTANDNCPGVIRTSTHNPGDTFALGTTTVTYTATDASGNNVSCSFDITIEDNQDPEITCPGDTIIFTDPNQCGAVFSYAAPVGTDNCVGAVTNQTDTTGLSSGSFFPKGTTTLEYTVNDAHGQSAMCSFTITVADTQYPVISCPGNQTMCATSYTGAYVTWVPPVGTDNCPVPFTNQTDGTGLTPGDTFPPGLTTIEYTVSDSAGNTSSCSFDVTVYPKPLAEFSFSTACQGQPIFFTNESTVLTGNIVSYVWDMGDGGGPITQVNPLHFYPATGNYTVTLIVTTNNGCIDTVSHVVTVTENPTAAFTTSGNVCLGSSVQFTNNSSVPVTYGGALNYQWTFGDGNSSTQTNPLHTYATSGTFTVTLVTTTDDGCSHTATSTVTIYPYPIPNFTVTNPCLGEPVQFTNFSSVGSGSYSSFWDFGDGNTSTAPNPSHLYASAGTYTVALTVTSDQGCTDSIQRSVTLRPIPVASFVGDSVCEGTPTTFTNSSSISSGSLSYAWELGDNSSSISSNPVHTYGQDGTYTVTLVATSTFGCSDTTTGTVEVYPTPEFSLMADSAVCFGDTNGAITATVTVGTSPYQYQLNSNPSQASGNFPNLGAGSYTVLVTDSNGCFAQNSISVGQPSGAVVLGTLGQVGILCHGDLTGSIEVAATGGTPSYVYSFDGGGFSSTSLFPNLPEGSYEIIAEDSRACADTITVVVTEPDTMVAAIESVTDVNCFAGTEGEIVVSATGGVNPYMFSIDGTNFFPADTFDNLIAGNYLITATDFNGCLDTVSATITQPDSAYLNILNIDDALCNGQSSGSISVVAGGGVPGYEYSLDGGPYQSDSNFNALPASTYTIELRDAHGCTRTVMGTINEPNLLTISATSQPVLCRDGSSGSITVTAQGGTQPYQYSINGGQTYQSTGTFSSLPAGSYVVSVKDANNCAQSQGVVINQPASAVSVNISNLQHILCREDSTGSASFATVGGTGSYTYSLDTGNTWQVSNTFNDLPAGSYLLLVQDVNGCTDDFNFNIQQPPAVLGIDTINVTNLACFGEPTGVISIVPEGGTPTYHYSINGGSTQQIVNTFNGLTAGVYTVEVEDFNGCSVSQSVVITEPSQLTLSINNQSNTVCEGDLTGALNVAGVGGVSPYTYTLDNGNPQSTGAFTALSSGNYTVEVEDANGCIVSQAIEITHDNPLPVAAFDYNSAGTSVVFDNQSQFFLTSFWSFGDGDTSALPEPIHNFGQIGSYIVTLTVSNACGVDSVSQIVYTGPNSIDEASAEGSILVYPNPGNGQFTMEIASTQLSGNIEMRVMDLNGKVMYTESIPVAANKLIKQITLNDLSTGIYLLEVQGNNWKQHSSLVIRK